MKTVYAFFQESFNHGKGYYAGRATESAANGVPIWIFVAFVTFLVYTAIRVYIDIRREKETGKR